MSPRPWELPPPHLLLLPALTSAFVLYALLLRVAVYARGRASPTLPCAGAPPALASLCAGAPHARASLFKPSERLATPGLWLCSLTTLGKLQLPYQVLLSGA